MPHQLHSNPNADSEGIVMKNVINSMRVALTMPREVRDYLATKARYNQTSMSGEVVRQVRAQMEKDRAAPANRATAANATA
jgi:hypothetical protein